MKEAIFQRKFLARYIPGILFFGLLFIFLLLSFIMSFFSGVRFEILVIAFFAGIGTLFLVNASLPRKMKLSQEGISVINVFNAERKIMNWKDVQSIEEESINRREQVMNRMPLLFIFGLAMLFLSNEYRRLTVIDSQLMKFVIYDYAYGDYDRILEILGKKKKIRKSEPRQEE
jgi:hypothetical protein